MSEKTYEEWRADLDPETLARVEAIDAAFAKVKLAESRMDEYQALKRKVAEMFDDEVTY